MIPRTGIIVSKKELLGLLLVFCLYVLLGGIVFVQLERPEEDRQRDLTRTIAMRFDEKLSSLLSDEDERRELRDLVAQLSQAHRRSLVDESGNETALFWSFGNSFFFAITVVTTIGYGHLSPSTTPGRLFCVLYATIGIPLTGILLAAIGGHYSQRLVRGIQRARKGRNSSSSVVYCRVVTTLTAAKCLLPWLLVFLVVPAGFFVWLEDWSFVDSFYYCFVTLSTIGFGDLVASNNFGGEYAGVYKGAVVLWVVFGLGYLAMILNYISRMMRCKQIRRVERRLSTSLHHTQQRLGHRLDEVYHLFADASRTRTIRPKHRAALKRMQSYPAPEVKDHTRNHKIQKLIRLVQTLKEDEPVPRPRRLSLPLPSSGGLQHAVYGRGSLQVFSSTALLRPQQNRNHVGNGYHLKVPAEEFGDGDRFRRTDVPYIDVVSAEGRVELDKRAIIEMDDLQCTRV